MTEPLLHGLPQSEKDRAEPLLRAGNTNCGGCGMSIGLNMLSRAIGSRPVQMVIPACCGIVTAGAFPSGSYGAPVVASTFASAAAVATGLAHVARLNGDSTRVICWAGDGGTYDIGLATVSAAAERGEDILYICYDNEIYGNTGGQRSSATPHGAFTTTTPVGKFHEKKDILSIMAAHDIPYAATLSLAHPEDTVRKIDHALDLTGFRFLHILSPCPTGWKSEPAEGIELVRRAVKAGLYPVCEIIDGALKIDIEPELSESDLAAYYEHQGRFQKTGVDLGEARLFVERQWRRLRSLPAYTENTESRDRPRSTESREGTTKGPVMKETPKPTPADAPKSEARPIDGVALCPEAQADGVPCYELGRDCETCERARRDPPEPSLEW